MLDVTTSIVAQIDESIQKIPGWSPADQLLILYTLVYASADTGGDVLELGSWCGRSAIVLGMAARRTGNTKVYSVDLFPEKKDWFMNTDGTYSFAVEIDGRKIEAYHEQTVWQEPYQKDIVPVYEKYNSIWEAFQISVNSNGLDDVIIPIKGDLFVFSLKAPKDLKLRLVFIDGDHGYEAVKKDIELLERYLVPGGWVCFDDAFTSYAGVNQAIEELIIQTGKYKNCQQLTRKLFVAQRV